MGGQRRTKKMRVDPSLAGAGGEREENGGAAGGEREENEGAAGGAEILDYPVQNELVMKTIYTCEDFENTSIIKWFQVMGSAVTRGVTHFERLIHNNFFAEPAPTALDSVQCNSLKEFILFFDKLESEKVRFKSFCGSSIISLEPPGGIQFEEVDNVRYEEICNFVHSLSTYVDQGSSGTTLLKKLVRRPIGFTSLDGLTPPTFGSHVADFFQEKFKCDPGYEFDEGIISELMKMSKVEKFVIQNSNSMQEGFFNEVFLLFFYRPNWWRSTLQHFEVIGHRKIMPFFTVRCAACLRGRNKAKFHSLNIFSKIGFPLKKLKFTRGILVWDARLVILNLDMILKSSVETLEELELGCRNTELSQCERRLKLPVMGRLKVLVVENQGYCNVKVTAGDILTKLPNLERCTLKLGGSRFFEARLANGNGNHPLKELKLVDEEGANERDIERFVRWFPNLRIVDLTFVEEKKEGFKAFWEKMGELPLQQIKISFSSKLKSNKEDTYHLYENAIGDNIEGFKELESLTLVHQAEHPFPLTIKLSRKLAKAANFQLRLLSFTNFAVIGVTEAQEVKENLANLVEHLPEIRATERRRSARNC